MAEPLRQVMPVRGDALGDRMKINYEDVTRTRLVRRMPVIIRVDGKAFHTLTRGLPGPYDELFMSCMLHAAKALVWEVQCVRLAYCQSDEISLLLVDYDRLTTEQWFGGNLQKMCSVAASTATAAFNYAYSHYYPERYEQRMGTFDARCFNIPREEVCNYFIWRQQDAERNSVSQYGRHRFGHAAMHGKGQRQVKEMLGDWETNPTWTRLGYAILATGEPDLEVPRFTEDRHYIERHLIPIEEPSHDTDITNQHSSPEGTGCSAI